ncbi:nickel transporter [Mesorhizobium sp. M7A.F.Ca.CA.001.07.2.1]|nr:nickel transporter [Mesorhizobium sp. M7A.F.Ca.CA.004.08.2.1]RUX89591.1 nickel transporter [Mesorhizobium sp. M7A.F.Ca.CA.004.08.1.1]RUX98747.1 nickel transporter [Mesorhizobium sp. M7A.F.Ca.CA.004.04.1.1]RUY23018.1 nickel transporter [Mesorhizobium sp. M7A.F.Ca.CA.004.12.1.1]RUY51777.1 nickel transporter [Mesorhizobium sp. M7A.F.Ca.CA.001.12.1.1]RUY91583.1 nickel transporter [Mesorhizobium sp. M7A.F.Ca.CA.001.10.2.1]RUZ51407.1 nickel transporter [Mesorhizobium sp. M7A.F.Ca.CA.004.05.2.1]
MKKTLRIIPVLDLKDGVVVRAQQGKRDRYRPIVTPLSRSPDVVAVAEGLRGLYPFSTFYIADLDAIEGGAPNSDALARLRTMAEPPELWVDAGVADEKTLLAALAERSLSPVLGSESQRDDMLLRRFRDHPDLILSLDFVGDSFCGPRSLLDEPELWPQKVIVMTLAKVGAAAGPDFGRLQEVKAKAGNRAVIAAGGVRDEADISALSAMGVAAALVATSLHNATLTPGRLASLGA